MKGRKRTEEERLEEINRLRRQAAKREPTRPASEGHERYRTLFEQSTVASIVVGPDGLIREANHDAARLLGYPSKWFIGQQPGRLFSLQAGSVLPCVSGDEPHAEGTINTVARHQDGSTLPVRLHWKSIRLSGQLHLLMSMLDITEQVQAERTRAVMQEIAEAANETDDLDTLFPTIRRILGILLDTTNFRIALYDPNEDRIALPYIVDERDTYTSFVAGKTPTAHVIHSGAALLLTPETRARLLEEGRLESVGEPAQAWLGVPLRIEGEVIGALIVQSYSDPDRFSTAQVSLLEQVCGQVAIAIQRKRADDARRDSESRYRSIFESTTDAVLIFDPENRVVEANPNACQPYGYEKEELLGLPAARLVHPDSFHGFAKVKDRIEEEGLLLRDQRADRGVRHLPGRLGHAGHLHPAGRSPPRAPARPHGGGDQTDPVAEGAQRAGDPRSADRGLQPPPLQFRHRAGEAPRGTSARSVF